MGKLIFVFVFLLFLPHLLFAATLKDQRRVEEEARDSLRFTEPQPSVISEPIPESTSYADLTFFQELLSRKYVRRLDALRAVLILLGEEEVLTKDEAIQISFLREKNILTPPIAQDFSPDKPLHKGLAAYMFCQALGLRGGVGARIFGMNQRYALNELIFTGLMTEGSRDDIVSGQEFIIIFTHAAEYLAQKNEAGKGKALK